MGGILGVIWSKFPGISRNLPKFSPGRPRVPPGKHPPEFRVFYRAFWGFTPWKWAVFPPRGVARGPRGVHLGKSRGFWGVPEAVLPCFLRMKKREIRPKIGQKSVKFDKIRQISPPADFAGPPENPRKSPRFSPCLHFSRGVLPPPKTPGICKKCKSGNFVQIFRQIFSAKKIFFSSKS